VIFIHCLHSRRIAALLRLWLQIHKKLASINTRHDDLSYASEQFGVMDRQANQDNMNAWMNTHTKAWFRDGGVQLQILRYLIVLLTCFVVGTLLLRVVYILGNRRRDPLTRRRVWESRKRRVSIIVPHAKSTPDRAMGSEGNAGARKEKDQVVNRERVPDVKDTCIVI
jgi:hypothetical protein